MGVLLSFVPPASSYIVDQRVLSKMRKSMLSLIKVLNDNQREEDSKNQATNLLIALPYIFLQFDNNKPNMQKAQAFADELINGNFLSVKVSDFKKKSLSKKRHFDRKFDFEARCHRQADKSATQGDFGKAMDSLLKIDAKANLRAASNLV